MKKVVFAIPTIRKPYQQTLDALEASVPLVEAAGWEHYLVNEVGCPYISAARATMLRKALDISPDVIVFIDHDLSWDAEDLQILIDTPGEVVAGTYRFKTEPEEYMGYIVPAQDRKPIVREDGAILMHSIPAGFLKVERGAVQKFMRAYPELLYGDPDHYSVDLFNHGAHQGVWYGEDYAFARRWRDMGGKIWCVPHLNITHHGADGKAYPGNFAQWLARLPGGSKDPRKDATC